eukprot:4305110-Prymnesium_polylepis.1
MVAQAANSKHEAATLALQHAVACGARVASLARQYSWERRKAKGPSRAPSGDLPVDLVAHAVGDGGGDGGGGGGVSRDGAKSPFERPASPIGVVQQVQRQLSWGRSRDRSRQPSRDLHVDLPAPGGDPGQGSPTEGVGSGVAAQRAVAQAGGSLPEEMEWASAAPAAALAAAPSVAPIGLRRQNSWGRRGSRFEFRRDALDCRV